MEVSRPVPWILAVALAGCGGTLTGGGADASSDQSSDQATKDAGSDVVGPGGPCPTAPPMDGDPCPTSVTAGFQCEYGTSFWAYCDVLATCDASGPSRVWRLQTAQGCPFPEGGNACPAQMPANGVACSPDNVTCGYPNGQCNCEGFCGGVFNPDAGIDWKCTTPDPSCPWPRPRFGSACTGTASCAYDICCSGSNMQCQNGYWQGNTMLGGCP